MVEVTSMVRTGRHPPKRTY